jgi:DNA-binding NarL/FixJ family response regulator
MKEIAEARQVAERTTRQQATVIYGKTGLSGRASLSAFFLEDLLLPSDDFVQTMDQNATS